jgi:glycosyltransferase involved in cell wall biosynthesis
MDQGGISVVIPVFNGARFLAGAIDSALGQDGVSVEVIVVDDGSTDATARVAAGYGERITYLRQPNRGPSAARNLGIARARGDFLAFLDSDDVWPPHNLFTLLAAMTAGVDIVLGQIQEQRFEAEQQAWVASRTPTFSLSLCAMLVRREAVARVGPLDETIRIGEDKDWFYRAQEAGQHIVYLAEHIALYHRRHETNMTRDMGRPETYLLSLLRKSLQRRGVFAAPASRETVETESSKPMDGTGS